MICRLKKWGAGRSKNRLDAGGGQSRPAEVIPACAQCLVQLLRVGDAPSVLAALLMAALAADHPNWATTFITAGCLMPLATMLGGPSEQVSPAVFPAVFMVSLEWSAHACLFHERLHMSQPGAENHTAELVYCIASVLDLARTAMFCNAIPYTSG